MKSLRTAHRIKRRPQAFTLVEMLCAITIFCLVGYGAFNVLRSGLLLSSQNVGINVSALRGRQMVDQIGEKSRYALFQPTLIDATGAAVSGSSADGILSKYFIGSPYVVKESGGTTGDIPATATQFVLEYRNTLPAPNVGDCVLMESISRPELEISNVSQLTASGNIQRRLITTTTAIGELARPSGYRVSGLLYRKEAFVFVNTDSTSNPRADLRHYNSVKYNTNFSSAANYNTLGSGFRRLNGQSYFTNVTTTSGAAMTTLNAVANSSAKLEYVARNNTASTFTTVPMQVRLWSINR